MDASTHKRCRRCHKDIKGTVIFASPSSGFGASWAFCSDGCFQCDICKKTLTPGDSYTLEKQEIKCRACFEHWHAQHVKAAQQNSKSGLGGRPKAPEEKGYVWKQVELINAATMKKAEEEKPKEELGKRTERPSLGTCAKCNQKIYGTLFQIRGGKGWIDLHPECFACKACGCHLDNEKPYVVDAATGHASCNACFSKELATAQSNKPQQQPVVQEAAQQTSLGKCKACGKDVFLQARTVRGAAWHLECVKCRKCKRLLGQNEPFALDDDGAGVFCEGCC